MVKKYFVATSGPIRIKEVPKYIDGREAHHKNGIQNIKTTGFQLIGHLYTYLPNFFRTLEQKIKHLNYFY